MSFKVSGQSSRSEYERSSIYNLSSIKIVMNDGSSMSGLVVQADTGKLTLKRYKNNTRKFDLISIRYKEIDFVKIRKRGAIGMGITLGALIGGLVGGAVGNATEPSNQYFVKGLHTASAATGGVLLGGIFGGVLCGIKGKHTIHGDKKLFGDFVLGLQLYKQ